MLNTKSAIDALIDSAVAKQLLPKEASLSGDETQTPLPVMLLTTLGVWLGAFPLVVGFIWLLFNLFGDDFFKSAPLLLLLGGVLLMVSIYQLRKANLAMFLEQLAFAVLLTGGLMFSIGLYQGIGLDELNAPYFVILALISTGVAYLIPLKWIRLVLGVIASAFIWLSWQVSVGWWRFDQSEHVFLLFMGSSYMLSLWAIILCVQYKVLHHKLPLTTAIEPFSNGWVVAGLIALAIESGRTFMSVNASGFASSAAYGLQYTSITGVLFAMVGFWFIGKRWLLLQQLPIIAVALLLSVLAWFMPSLGGAIFVLAVAAATKRYSIALFSAIIGVWVIGAFYYQLHWSLSNKALLLVLVAIGLGLLAWFQQKQAVVSHVVGDSANYLKDKTKSKMRHMLLASGLLVLLVANVGIWQKEELIAKGTPVFIKLAPVDPRSLMQGDYMALNYEIPPIPKALTNMSVLYAVAERNQSGDAQITRISGPKTALADREFLIKLKYMPRGWTVVSNAWYFTEGTGKQWENAKYGEFRVKKDGSALLVGLADENLKPINHKLN